ncbi:MAG: nucleotidyltransferase family protein [Candidatus Helarchaeota archaeon]|nr:nucleotidyltransferase family protein [Candidatus Helarchaeota archaeon]
MDRLNKFKTVLQKHKKELKRKYQVKEIGIFGSYVHGKQRKKSDVDILIDFEEEPGLFKFIELENYLSKILGVKTDLVMKDTLKPYIGKYILNEVIYV